MPEPSPRPDELPDASTLLRRAILPAGEERPVAFGDVRDWLKRALFTGRSGLPQGPDDDVAEPLVRLFPGIQWSEKNLLEIVIVALLSDWRSQPEAWPSKGARSLLLLVRHMNVAIEALSILRSVVEDSLFFRQLAPEVQNDLLGILVDLALPLEPAFWEQLAVRDMNLLGPVAFGALADTHYEQAFALIPRFPLHEDVQLDLVLRLPAMLGRWNRLGPADLDERMERLAEALRTVPLLDDLFRREFKRMGRPLPNVAEPEQPSGSSKEDAALKVLKLERESSSLRL